MTLVEHPTRVPGPTPAQNFGEYMMKAVADPNITADKLEILLRVRREILEAEAREAFANAFAQMASEIPQVDKNGVVELRKGDKLVGTYNFAKWEDMDVVIRPILHTWGFALSFASRPSPKGVLLVGELAYGGFSKFSEIELPPDAGPGRGPLQAVGGAISYGKRYTAELLLNIVRRGIDDDAITVGIKRINADQVAELAKLLEDTKTTTENFLKVMVGEDITALADVRERDFARLLNALNEKKRVKKERGNA
jgi:hypothetical protein